jgi:hypothetical protein
MIYKVKFEFDVMYNKLTINSVEYVGEFLEMGNSCLRMISMYNGYYYYVNMSLDAEIDYSNNFSINFVKLLINTLRIYLRDEKLEALC